jgi:hypothetical protein
VIQTNDGIMSICRLREAEEIVVIYNYNLSTSSRHHDNRSQRIYIAASHYPGYIVLSKNTLPIKTRANDKLV